MKITPSTQFIQERILSLNALHSATPRRLLTTQDIPAINCSIVGAFTSVLIANAPYILDLQVSPSDFYNNYEQEDIQLEVDFNTPGDIPRHIITSTLENAIIYAVLSELNDNINPVHARQLYSQSCQFQGTLRALLAHPHLPHIKRN